MLPDITINTKLDAREFIYRLNLIVEHEREVASKNYTIDHIQKGEDSLIIMPKDENGNEKLGLLVFNSSNHKKKVFVELKARTWKIEPATYDLYSNEAKRILLPLLKDYNKKYKTQIRLSIQSNGSPKIKLPKLANDLFLSFTQKVYSNKLHPTDWKRFYFFVSHCNSRNVKLEYYDLHRLLLENGFDEKLAKLLSERYNIIRDFLRIIKSTS